MSFKEKILKFKNNLINRVNNISEKYVAIQKAGLKLEDDFRELFQYGAISFDKLIYQSNGVMGIYLDFNDYKNSLPIKLSKIREDFKTLENIVFNKHNFNTRGVKNIKTNIATVHTFNGVTSNMSTASTVNNMRANIINTDVSECAKKNLAGLYGDKKNYTPEYLSQIINLKNKYFWKSGTQLQDIIQKKTNTKIRNLEYMLSDAMSLKVIDPSYNGVARMNYDSRIAPSDMKSDIIKAYTQSNKSLKEISYDLELKYGMYISASTISVNSRKYLRNNGLNFKNRKDAKKHYGAKASY